MSNTATEVVLTGRATHNEVEDYILGDIITDDTNKHLSDYILYNIPKGKRVEVRINILED